MNTVGRIMHTFPSDIVSNSTGMSNISETRANADSSLGGGVTNFTPTISSICFITEVGSILYDTGVLLGQLRLNISFDASNPDTLRCPSIADISIISPSKVNFLALLRYSLDIFLIGFSFLDTMYNP
eukprot:jgi/Orpsp1_1/1187243/evm.model.d7180000056311.1